MIQQLRGFWQNFHECREVSPKWRRPGQFYSYLKQAEQCRENDGKDRFHGIEIMRFRLQLDLFDQLGGLSKISFIVFRWLIRKWVCSVTKCRRVMFLTVWCTGYTVSTCLSFRTFIAIVVMESTSENVNEEKGFRELPAVEYDILLMRWLFWSSSRHSSIFFLFIRRTFYFFTSIDFSDNDQEVGGQGKESLVSLLEQLTFIDFFQWWIPCKLLGKQS